MIFITWDHVIILDQDAITTKTKIREALHIHQHTNLMNRDVGVEVSHIWDSLVTSNKSTTYLHSLSLYIITVIVLYIPLSLPCGHLVVLPLSLRKAFVRRPKHWLSVVFNTLEHIKFSCYVQRSKKSQVFLVYWLLSFASSTES